MARIVKNNIEYPNIPINATQQYMINNIMLNTFYPIGTYYETSIAPTVFDPNIEWGGIWVLEQPGLVHVGGNSITVKNANSNNGAGSKDFGATSQLYTPAGTVDVTVAGHAITNNELPKLSGTARIRGYTTSAGSKGVQAIVGGTGILSVTEGQDSSVVKNATSSHEKSILNVNFGSGTSHTHSTTSALFASSTNINVMQSAINVYRWHRIS